MQLGLLCGVDSSGVCVAQDPFFGLPGVLNMYYSLQNQGHAHLLITVRHGQVA
jgi:hypothetical protein